VQSRAVRPTLTQKLRPVPNRKVSGSGVDAANDQEVNSPMTTESIRGATGAQCGRRRGPRDTGASVEDQRVPIWITDAKRVKRSGGSGRRTRHRPGRIGSGTSAQWIEIQSCGHAGREPNGGSTPVI
jgi:hypothetical protein